jgi:hypothetical protein
MWQRQSPPQLRGKVRNHRTCGSAGAHLSWEARSGAIGHVAAPEPTLVGMRGLKSYDMWKHRSPPQSESEVRMKVHLGLRVGFEGLMTNN